MFRKILAITALTTISLSLFAAEPPRTKEQYCKMAEDQVNFQNIIKDSNNRLSFNNYGGLMNGGVCWWHSMFTRNATYLGIFQPDKNKPSHEEALKIIQHIVVSDAVTYIPGYKNLAEFSADYSKEIESALEAWQITDGGVGFGWIRGITGHPTGDAATLKKTMDELYDKVANKHQIVYQMLGMAGIEAHAWLVVDVNKTNNGYFFTVVDSNYDSLQTHVYYNNENSIRSYGNVMVYNSRNMTSTYKNVATRLCKLDISNIDVDIEKNKMSN